MASVEKAFGEEILVVDDDALICRMLAEALEREGYQPVVCSDPEEALKIAQSEGYGMAFVDINLPHMSGLELAARLKERSPDREVVIITGSGTIDSAVQAIKIGAYDYLRKPFSLAELNLCLKRYQERKALRRRIRQAERRYTDLVQNVPLLIYALRRDLQLDFVNQACLQILGFTPEEALSIPDWFVERIHPEDRDRITSLFRATFQSGGPSFSAECRFLHKGGQSIDAIIKSIPAYGERGSPAVEAIEGILVDITERVFLEKALVQKEKIKTLGAISAEVAHEIRNPLVSIGGFARRLQMKYPDLAETDIIVRESQRLEKILDRIKNYLQPVEVFAEECSVNAVINDCLDLLSPEIEQRQLVCRLNLEPTLPPVVTDRDILSQICINLIRDAIESTGEGAVLGIKSFQSAHSVHIEFEHTSQMQTTKNPEHVFLPFDEGGESIGLPLCHRLARNMGGLLSFSEQDGKISFTISLPKGQSSASPGWSR